MPRIRRHVLATLTAFAVGATVCIAPGLAGPRPDSMRTFRFDPRSGQLKPCPETIRNGDRVHLEVVGPNIFRYDYTLRLLGVDTHSATLPAGLAGLIASENTTVREIPPEPTAVTSLAGSGLRSNGDSVIVAARAALASLHAVEDSLARYGFVRSLAVVDQRMLEQARADSTNCQARAGIVALHDELRAALESGRAARGSGDLRPRQYEQGTQREAMASHRGGLVGRWQERTSSLAGLAARLEAREFTRNVRQLVDLESTASHAELVKKLQEYESALKDRALALYAIWVGVRPALANCDAILAFALDAPEADDTLRRTVTVSGADRVRAELTISPRGAGAATSTTTPPPSATRSYSASTDVEGRWFTSFGAGLGALWFEDPGYYVDPGVTAALDTLRAAEGDEVEYSPVVLAGLLYSFSPWFALGPSLGLATNTPFRYLGGVSAQFFHGPRVGLTAGWALGKQKVLQDQQVGSGVTTSAPRTREQWEGHPFVCVTFTLVLPVK